MSKCTCEENVLDLGCSIHGPVYKAYRESMLQPSLTDQLQQAWKKHKNSQEKLVKVPNRKTRRKARKGNEMKSTQIKRTKVSDWMVSTVYIEPFNYYETAVRDNTKPGKRWEPREWSQVESIAIAQHDDTVRILGL